MAESDKNEVITRTINNNHPVCSGSTPDQVFYANCLFTTGCSGDLERWKRVGTSTFTEYTDGTAFLKMTVQNVQNSNYEFDVEVIFDSRTQTDPAGSPKLEICTNAKQADWYYYTVTNGSHIGKKGLDGAILSITRKSSSFQVGTGASLYDPNEFGASGWLNYNILSHPTAFHFSDNAGLDFNFELTGGAFDFGATAEEICPGEKATLEAYATGGTPPYTYQWNNGLGSGKTKMVFPTSTTTYRVTITDDVEVLVKDCSSLGDRVWIDENGDGRQDAGEPGLDGVKVELKNGNGTVIQTDFTSNGGKYLFEGLTAGTYKVCFTAPNGYKFTQQDIGPDDKDSDADPTNGMTGNYTLGNDETNLTVDAGLFKPASIGDYVWLDEDKNGIQDNGEKGLKDIDVELYNDSNQKIKTTKTNSSGLYFFGDLDPGRYYVKFILPSGLMTTSANQGNNDTRDSDVDGSNGSGTTPFYTLSSGEYDSDVDGGAKCTVTVVAAGGKTVCPGDCADIDATASNGSGTYTYTWSHGLGTGRKKVVCPTQTTTYTVTVTDVDGCCEAVDDVTVLVKDCIDLQLIKSVDKKTPDVGEQVTFTVAVKNDGPSNASGVQVKDFVPNGFSNVTAISGGGSLSGSTITWNNLNVSKGATVNLTFKATVNAPGQGVDFDNIAEITKANEEDTDSTPGNGADTDNDGKIGPLDNDGSQDPDDGDDATVNPSCDLVADAGPDCHHL